MPDIYASIIEPNQRSNFEELRKSVFAGPDHDLNMTVGFFTLWYAAVDTRLTLLLYEATRHASLSPGHTSMDMFLILTNGMDARVKLHRFRQACGTERPWGTTLKQLFSHFEDVVIPLRNKLMHSFVVRSEPGDEFIFLDVSKPYWDKGVQESGHVPTKINALDLFSQGIWLNQFSEDLRVFSGWGGLPKGTLEIESPRSWVPRRQSDRPPQAKRTNAHKRGRKLPPAG